MIDVADLPVPVVEYVRSICLWEELAPRLCRVKARYAMADAFGASSRGNWILAQDLLQLACGFMTAAARFEEGPLTIDVTSWEHER